MAINKYSQLLLEMQYKRLQEQNGLDIFYKDCGQIYKVILLINNYGRARIITDENLNRIKQKIYFRPELIQNKKIEFLTILLHVGRDDRYRKKHQYNMLDFPLNEKAKGSKYNNCFSEEWTALKNVRIEEELLRKQMKVDSPVIKNFPYITFLLILVSIILFIYPADSNTYGISWISLSKGNYYTLITYVFLHGGIIHLLNNCLAIGCIGSMLEIKLGKMKYMILLLISAIYSGCATAGYKYIIGEANIPTIGLSGILYAICGTLIVYQVYHKRRHAFLIFYVVVSLLAGLFIPYTDSMVHIAGLFIGNLFMAADLLTRHCQKIKNKMCYYKYKLR